MNLFDVKINKECVVIESHIKDDIIRFRLMDMGLYRSAKARVLDRKRHKKSIILTFCGVKYMLDSELAKAIEVEYA